MKIFPVLACVILFLIAGCESREQTIVATTQKMRTVCIGRHLIDLPEEFAPVMPLGASFRPATEGMQTRSVDVSIVQSGITRANFAAALQKRREEIAAFADNTTDILKDVITRGSDDTLFRILRVGESYTSELHLLKGDHYLTIEAKSHQGRFKEAEEILFALAKNIAATKAFSQAQPGFCIGPVVVDGIFREESARYSFRSKEQPDMLIAIEVDTYGRDESETLLQRVGGPNSLLKKFDVRNKVLREGELQVAGMRAQELVGSVKLGKNRDKKQFGFTLETMRAKPGPEYPRIHLELDTGQGSGSNAEPHNALSDEQALALWDSITGTIRLRSPAHR